MVEYSYDIYSAMQEGKPLVSYKKAILGKVRVVVLNPFNDAPEEIILYGDPNNPKDLDTCVVDLWDVKQKSFFERMNKFHLQKGNLVPYERKDESENTINYNALTDEEIAEFLDKPYFTIKQMLDNITEENTLLRVLRVAKERDKSNKIISNIEERISEVQGGR